MRAILTFIAAIAALFTTPALGQDKIKTLGDIAQYPVQPAATQPAYQQATPQPAPAQAQSCTVRRADGSVLTGPCAAVMAAQQAPAPRPVPVVAQARNCDLRQVAADTYTWDHSKCSQAQAQAEARSLISANGAPADPQERMFQAQRKLRRDAVTDQLMLAGGLTLINGVGRAVFGGNSGYYGSNSLGTYALSQRGAGAVCYGPNGYGPC